MEIEKKFDFEDKQYFIKKITSKELIDGRKIYTTAFKKAVENGAILKKSLDDHMRKQGLWDDEKQEEYLDLIKKTADLEYRIKSGFYKKASELKEKALELRKIRNRTSEMLSARNSMDSVTAEGLAENEQFNYYVTVCVYDYLTQRPVFTSVQDYEDKGDSGLAVTCAEKFANYFYGLEENFQDTLFENKVLKKLNLLDKKGYLVDRQGRRVDEEGNLLNDEGARVDAEGNRIDINNNPILDDNVIDSLEFDDDLDPPEEKVEEKPKKRAPRKKKTEEEPAI
jgi:hypothetical protein